MNLMFLMENIVLIIHNFFTVNKTIANIIKISQSQLGFLDRVEDVKNV